MNLNIMEGFHTFSTTLYIQCVSLERLELGLSDWAKIISKGASFFYILIFLSLRKIEKMNKSIVNSDSKLSC